MPKDTAILLDPGNPEVAALFEDAGNVLLYTAIGDLEVTPALKRLALNGRYLDNLIRSIVPNEGQCAILVAVRPVRSSAHGSHSSFGEGDDLLLSLDQRTIQRAQAMFADDEEDTGQEGRTFA